MKIGTKSVLFGVHQFLLHPLFIAIGWWQEYGFRRVRIAERVAYTIVDFETGNQVDFIDYTDTWLLDPRLWVAFCVHDLGYIGKPNMDGSEGEEHVWLGAKIMHWLFDRPKAKWVYKALEGHRHLTPIFTLNFKWRNFTLYHSRFYAKKNNSHFSKLCVADKLSIVLEPWWLYLPRVNWSGEIDEYMKLARPKYDSMRL